MSSNKKWKEISLFLPFSSTAFSLSAILNNYYGHMTYNWNHVTFFVDFFSLSIFRGITLSLYAWIIIKLGGGIVFFLIGVTFFYDLITWNDRVFFVVLIGRFYKIYLRVFRAIFFFLHAEGFFFNYVWRFFSPLCSLQQLYLCIMPTYSVYLLPFSRLLIGQNAQNVEFLFLSFWGV